MSNLMNAPKEVEEFVKITHSFVKKTISPMFDRVFADGDLDLVPSILDKAFKIGLAASPDKQMPGYEYGIWGYSKDKIAVKRSLLLLSIIAEVCGGVAMNLHSQGIATNLIMQSGKVSSKTPTRVAVALQEEFGLPGYGTIGEPDKDLPARIITEAKPSSDGYSIKGIKSFVYSISDVEAFVLFCRVKKRSANEWGCFLVPVSTHGLKVIPLTQRTGIRACNLQHIELDNVHLPKSSRLDKDGALALLKRTMCLNWLGISAMATGIAQGAVRAARKYASVRFQGGSLIENHPAIQMLLAESDARVKTSYALISQISELDILGKDILRQSAIVKLAALDLCVKAVTDSLQVFGGYGYMEDYGMEKRLRDVTVLKSASGSSNYLKLLIFEAGREITE